MTGGGPQARSPELRPSAWPPVATRACLQAVVVAFDGGASGDENMRRDSDLLRGCAAGEITRAVRLYWFDPACLSLGRVQPESDVDLAACARDGIDVVRRPSGGRAVLHADEVTYAVIARGDDAHFGGDVMTSCARIHAAVACGLAALGVETQAHAPATPTHHRARALAARADCFAAPAAHELLDAQGRKLVGSAQARRGGALLQHGSVMLSVSRAADYLLPAGADTAADGGSSSHVRGPSFGLRRLVGRDLPREEVIAALAEGFRRTVT